MPEHGLASWALSLESQNCGASRQEQIFRNLSVPLIVRIEHDKILIDLRTILEHDESLLVDILKQYLKQEHND